MFSFMPWSDGNTKPLTLPYISFSTYQPQLWYIIFLILQATISVFKVLSIRPPAICRDLNIKSPTASRPLYCVLQFLLTQSGPQSNFGDSSQTCAYLADDWVIPREDFIS